MREEWTVGHSQGIHPGTFTEKQAREWIAQDKATDHRRQLPYQNKQRLLRRYVTEWEEISLDAPNAEEN